MKLLTREFTRGEKALLVLLAVVILALGYYKFFYTPTKEAIASANAQADNLEFEKTIADAKLAEMRAMKKELDSLEADGTMSLMPSYNNAKAEVQFLNDVLKGTAGYNISIASVTRDGNQIRRNISITFTVSSYEQAEQIIRNLETCEDRCLVSNVSVYCSRGSLIADKQSVTVNATATFYETMYGGTADSGLPK